MTLMGFLLRFRVWLVPILDRDPDTFLDEDVTEAVYSCDVHKFKKRWWKVILQQQAQHHSSTADVFRHDLTQPKEFAAIVVC